MKAPAAGSGMRKEIRLPESDPAMKNTGPGKIRTGIFSNCKSLLTSKAASDASAKAAIPLCIYYSLRYENHAAGRNTFFRCLCGTFTTDSTADYSTLLRKLFVLSF